MIPKIIHYCWFGGKPLPALAERCIRSWRKFFPDYEIKLWSEVNFDISSIAYTKEAYNAKRYAFVSDYVRYWALYNYGGIYFDTDVEVIRPMEDILQRGGYMGIENSMYVAAGLGMAVEPENLLLKEMLEIYRGLHFVNPDGSHNLKTVVQYTSEILIAKGLKKVDTIQKIEGIWIYPKEYFNPYDCVKNKFFITDKTHSIHYYAGSWITPKERFMKWVERRLGKKTVRVIHCIKTLVSSKKSAFCAGK